MGSVADLNHTKHSDRHAEANTVDTDQMLPKAASDHGLQCLPRIQHFFRHINR